MSQANAQWLQDSLATLLNSPYVHIPTRAPGGLRLGHGPIDLFSTRFNNFFASDATGTVAGVHVDRDGLKRGLLALQKRWNADSAEFTAQSADEPDRLATTFAWTPSGSGDKAQVSATASVSEEGNAMRITSLVLDGDSTLFQSQ